MEQEGTTESEGSEERGVRAEFWFFVGANGHVGGGISGDRGVCCWAHVVGWRFWWEG